MFSPRVTDTSQTIRQTIAKWSRKRYCVSDEELTLGMKSIAVPISKRNVVVAASFGVSYSSNRGREDGSKGALVHELLAMAQKVSSP
ncbi:MAG: IclR family transcriptional regulator C-terminal domain-containing protein [Desulfomonilaceae bacterium]